MARRNASEGEYIGWSDVHDWARDLRTDTGRMVLFHITPNFTSLGKEKFTVTAVLTKKLTNVWTTQDVVVSEPWPNIGYKSVPAMLMGMLWNLRVEWEKRESEAGRQASF